MKKITAGILTAALVIALGGATVSAVGRGQTGSGAAVQERKQEQLYKNAGGNCIYDGDCPADSDGDGVCDYHENGACRTDTDGNGWHHSSGSGSGAAHGYRHGHGCR